MRLPVKMSSLALARPTSLDKRCVPPAPGMMPSFVSGNAICAFGPVLSLTTKTV